MIRAVIVVFGILLSFGVIASDGVETPYKGMWYPVGEPGSGFVLDQEADTLVVTFFSYQDGEPLWYLASGALTDGRFEAEANTYDGGSCLGCEHQPATADPGPQVEITFVGDTTAWMSWDGGEPIAVRALPFDSPLFQTFGPDTEHGTPGMFDLSGRWVFASDDKTVFPFDVEFGELIVLDPGGWSWGETFDAVPPEEDPWGFICFSNGPSDTLPQCWTHKRGVNDWDEQPALSAFWGDLGPASIDGYTSDRVEPGSGDVRGTGSGNAFRLTGPLLDSDTRSMPPNAMDEKLPHYFDKGMWMEPGKPGSGLTLDWQNGTVVATIFTYREDGLPVWFQGHGYVDDHAVEFELLEYDAGSCFNCNHQEPTSRETGSTARIEFTSKSIAMMSLDGEPAFPIRSLAFDVPVYRTFPGPGEYGEEALYDLRGEWLFVHHLGLDTFSRTVTFEEATRYNEGRGLGWLSADGNYEFRCDDRQIFPGPQCRFLKHGPNGKKTLLSAYWADIGDRHIIGYEGRPLRTGAGGTRGDEIIYGFRLSGPPN